MALWNKVVTGFDKDEETVNFGARTVAENNGSLYETSTIATIQSDGKVTRKPNILASVQYSRLCIAVDKSVTIFTNETCEEILLSLGFGSLITCYSISEDGEFLFVVLSTGVLYCLHLLSEGKLIFSKNISNNKDNLAMKIFSQECNGSISLNVVTKTGIIYSVSTFNTEYIKVAIASKDDVALEEHIKSIECLQLFKGFSYEEVCYVAVGKTGGMLSIAMICSNSLFVWPSEQYSDFKTLPYKYTKVQFFKSCSTMLCLRADNTLSVVCPKTLLGLKIHSKPVLDFVIIENEDDNYCQILILTKSEEETDTNVLQVVSYPDLEQKFQINVSPMTFLVEIMDSCDETILYLEGVSDAGNDIENVDTLRLKTVLESIPECQLQRLLRRGQFEAAEAFARKFNLSAEPIYCAQAVLFESQFGPWGKKATDPVQLDTLISLLDKIQNVQYIAEFCSKALVPDYKGLRKLHMYARTRIVENAENMKNIGYLKVLHLIDDTLHKLDTFHMIWGCQVKSECYDENTIKEWIRFSRADYMEEYKMLLSLGEMEVATLIWTRHLSGRIKKISVKDLQDIFAILPERISPTSLWPWLTHFIPSLLSLLPDAICEIIFWGSRKIKSLEQFYHAEWPEIGIDFANRFIKLLQFESNQQCLYIHHEYMNQNSALRQFVLLMQALSDIQKLKCNYRLTIRLNSYIGNPMEVSHILLDKIHVDAIPEFVNKFLKQYMLNNSLQHDDVFASYIQKTLRNSKSWWSSMEAPWEKRTVAIIALIHDMEIKLQQTLDVLRKAAVPWSSTMVALAEASSKIDHALSAVIKTEHNYVPIKLILKKYGFECIGVNDKLISRVIRENRDDMVTDIYHLTKNDKSLRQKAFSLCINHHLSKGDFEKVTAVLQCLEDDILLYCCLCIVNHVTACFSLKSLPKSVDHHIEMLNWVKFRLENFARSNKAEAHNCRNTIISIDELCSLYKLRKEFQVNITFEEYQLRKNQVLKTCIKELYSDLDEHGRLRMVYDKTLKIANLLKLEKLCAISLLLDCTKDIETLKCFNSSVENSVTLMAEDCEYINKICLLTLQYVKPDVDVTNLIKNLSDSALCVCSNDELRNTLHLNVWVNLYHNSFHKFSSNSISTKEEEKANLNSKLYPIYKDLAIAVDHLLLPLFKEMFAVQKVCKDYSIRDKQVEMAEAPDEDYIQLTTEERLNAFLDNMKKLKVEHNDYCLLQFVKNFHYNYCALPNTDVTILKESSSTLLHFVTILLRKLISTRTFDLHLSLSCLFMIPETEARKWISTVSKSFQLDYARDLKISVLGYEYFRLTKNQELMQTFNDHHMLHYWAQRLSQFSISYKEVLISDATSKREILERVMSYNDENMVPLLHDFCYNFGFDISDCLLLYLETVVKTWNPELDFSVSSVKKELYIRDDKVNELKNKCNTIVTKISDKVALKECIYRIWSQISFYYYEVFIILMDLIDDKNPETRNYLCFLQNYTRDGQPTRIEHEEWIHRYPGHTSLPPISEWRLPFLPKIELWKLITPELNLKTYKRWLDIAPVLKLQKHIICTLAIKGEVNRVWQDVGTKHKTENWALCPRNTSLLHKIKKCIKKMTSSDALYYGTAALYYVVNHTPPGADQVAAAQECYNYAQMSAENSTVLEEGMLEKIKFKYLRFTSEHILRTHGLEKTSYLSLIGNPCKLVRDLYMDESIPQRFRTVTDHRPDINSAVNSLSQLFSINLIKLRLELLHEWLQPDSRYIKINQSITDTFSVPTNSEQNMFNHDNLLRACYILEHGNVELHANYLINIGFGDNNEEYSPEIRCSALHVLQLILDTNALEALTKRSLQTIRKYMKSLKYVGKLELLGLGYNVNTFEACSKYELVQILWKTQSHSPQALSLIAQICIDFEIHDYSVWDKNLTQMTKLHMVNELKVVLLQVQNINTVVNSNGYMAGWQIVITEPFRKMDVQPSIEQIDNCIEALRLLHSCPIGHMLRYTNIIKYCFQCQQPQFATALLPLLNEDDKKHVLQTLQKSFKIQKVLDDLTDMSSSGILSVPYCRKILQDAFLEK